MNRNNLSKPKSKKIQSDDSDVKYISINDKSDKIKNLFLDKSSTKNTSANRPKKIFLDEPKYKSESTNKIKKIFLDEPEHDFRRFEKPKPTYIPVIKPIIKPLIRPLVKPQNLFLDEQKYGFLKKPKPSIFLDEPKQIFLNEEKIEKPKKICCSKCGRNSHTSGDCYATTHISGSTIDAYEASKLFDFVTDKVVKKQKCSRCGRNTHVMKDCFATTHINGDDL